MVLDQPSKELVQNIVQKNLPQKPIHQLLRSYGAGEEEIARTIATVMHYSDRDIVRLKAAQLAAEILGMHQESNAGRISLVINGDSVNMLIPRG
jgi:hypothetical protein